MITFIDDNSSASEKLEPSSQKKPRRRFFLNLNKSPERSASSKSVSIKEVKVNDNFKFLKTRQANKSPKCSANPESDRKTPSPRRQPANPKSRFSLCCTKVQTPNHLSIAFGAKYMKNATIKQHEGDNGPSHIASPTKRPRPLKFFAKPVTRSPLKLSKKYESKAALSPEVQRENVHTKGHQGACAMDPNCSPVPSAVSRNTGIFKFADFYAASPSRDYQGRSSFLSEDGLEEEERELSPIDTNINHESFLQQDEQFAEYVKHRQLELVRENSKKNAANSKEFLLTIHQVSPILNEHTLRLQNMKSNIQNSGSLNTYTFNNSFSQI